MPRPPANETLRLFVAAYPPLEVAETLLAEVAALGNAGHRLTPREQVHLTLQFIGQTRPRDLEEVEQSVARSVAGIEPFELCAQRLIGVPERGPARLVAAQTDSPAGLLEIVRRLASRLAHRPRSDSADRFLPHLTLCRFAPGKAAQWEDRSIAPLGFALREVVLMRSTLGRAGARHSVVRRFPLA